MIVKFTVSCMGYSVGGYNHQFEINLDDKDVEGMTEEQKDEFISECINEYIEERLSFGYEICK